MQVKVETKYLVKYGPQDDGSIVMRETLKNVTPDLRGRAVKFPDGSFGVVIKMKYDDVGLLVKSIPQDQFEAYLESQRRKIILPGN